MRDLEPPSPAFRVCGGRFGPTLGPTCRFPERIEAMINVNPIAKLLLHAHSDERLSYEQMVQWSEEFGLSRSRAD